MINDFAEALAHPQSTRNDLEACAMDRQKSAGLCFLNIVIWVAGWFVYLVAKKVRSRQGVDLDSTYRELPTE